MTVDTRLKRDYRAFRAQGLPAATAHACAFHVRMVREWEDVHVRDHGDDSMTAVVSGDTYEITVARDDIEPSEFDCYSPEEIDAWREDRWRFAIVTVTTTINGEEGFDSLGGVDVGSYWQGVTLLTEAQQIIAAVIDNGMIVDARENAGLGQQAIPGIATEA